MTTQSALPTWTHRFTNHIYRHPSRLLVTVLIIVALGWLPAAIALKESLQTAHQGRIDNCRAINELRRQIYVAAIDLGADRVVANRFLPTQECESVP